MTALDPLVYERVKQATVAIAVMVPRKSGAPFTILGSGFCIDPRGLVVTCRHVQEATLHPDSLARIQAAVSAEKSKEFDDLQAGIPHAIFHHPQVHDGNVAMFPVPVMTSVNFTDFDLALLRLHPHKAFPHGFPSLEILDYAEVQETMPIGICGYPLGNVLQEQFGTVGSSFTAGSLSSIIPVRGVPRDDVRRFQLNAAATHGNSGGPVFSPKDGKVFGVLQGGPGEIHKGVAPYQGLTFAEPVWQIFRNDTVQDIMAFVPPKVGEKPQWPKSSKRRSKPKKKRGLVSRP